ncbi:GNAT family N-acetyltransferase [Allorhizocola rhizosphaerae]|uniref:GNAT family N-acetyltransferase n=1 Tax=Allorhizocola rhizosphaerae TaxID=1872709 RepID=UPI000E3C469A|nr:GNAT family N-acetyltransferase [Allorhizocola rhizosphaerae]
MPLVAAEQEHVESIRRWRNHPQVRGTAIYTKFIPEDMHRAWWESVSADPARHVMIYLRDGVPAGAVTFTDHDPEDGSVEWGFFLDVDGLQERGDLLAAWMELEKEAIAYSFDVMKVTRLGGRTLARNKPVLALHRRFGFVEVPDKSYTTEVDGVLEQVIWTEMTADQRRTASQGRTTAQRV